MAAPQMTVIIDVINDSANAQVPAANDLQLWCTQALKHLPSKNKPVSLAIRIVDENESAEINLAYRQKDYATNVLSFGTQLPESVITSLEEIPLGDLLICAPVVAREADEQGKTLNAHWAHMVIHGLLHLHGYDHETDVDAAEMETLESDILLSLSFEKPYQADLLQH
jgi:probable rRNA maturation factor